MKRLLSVLLLLFSSTLHANECYNIDFEGISIVEALRIYSDMTKQNYVLDKKLIVNSSDIQLHLKCVSAKTILDSLVIFISAVVEKHNDVNLILPIADVKSTDTHKIIKLYNSKAALISDTLVSKDIEGKVNNLRIKAIDDTNSLLLSGNELTINSILPVIAELDKPRKQFMIHAKLISASSSFIENLGITLKSASSANDSVLASAASTFAAAATGGGSLIFQKTTGILLNAQLQAAVTDGSVSLLSEPRTIAYEGQPSTISQGARIPYQTVTANQGSHTQFIDAALNLTVTPRLGDDKGRLILDVVFTKNSPGVETAAGISIDTREVKTTVALNTGDTVMLGGIDETTDSVSEGGIPVLKDIPYLGFVFGNLSANKSNNKLVLFISTDDF